MELEDSSSPYSLVSATLREFSPSISLDLSDFDSDTRPKPAKAERRLKTMSWHESNAALTSKTSEEVVKLNVGGHRFETLKSTLTNKGVNFFTGLLKGEFHPFVDDEGYIFIDRDPGAFRVVLNYFRTGIWEIPDEVTQLQVSDMARFLSMELPPAVSRAAELNCRNDFLTILNSQPSQKGLKFTGGYFPFLDICRISFSGCDFQRANLSNSEFTECGFKKCLMDHAILTDCLFNGCIFENTKSIHGAKGSNLRLTNCHIKCKCYCGGKKCAFQFTFAAFDTCEFFNGEEFERHPMAFTDCVFKQCRIFITLYNVVSPNIKFTRCNFAECEFLFTYSSPSQIENQNAHKFLRRCLESCVANEVKVQDICKPNMSEAMEDSTISTKTKTFFL